MDEGHEKLIVHIEILLEDARNSEFHDFKNTVATPKVYLVSRLQALIDNTKNGLYDN